jgi:hypothetical protein
MKKLKTVVGLLAVTDICIEASEARAWLLDSSNKGLPKKKHQEDREVNTTECGNRKQQPVEQKEKRPFRRSTDAMKWCELYRTSDHDLEECMTFRDRKNMLAQLAA